MSSVNMNCFKDTYYNEGINNALIISLQCERTRASCDSWVKGTEEEISQFCIAKGRVVALGRGGTAHHPELT